MKDISIGFFGGSFDPIHFGHIHLALSILEKFHLDQIVFCPTFISPFKQEARSFVAGDHRLEMIKRAINPLPFFTSYDYEIVKEGTSYTIDTIKHFKNEMEKQHLSVQIHLILGDDMLEGLPRWKSVNELLSLANPIVGCRKGDFSLPENLLESTKHIIKERCVEIPIMDISSTVVRQRLKKGEYCGHLVPQETLEYIHQYNLY